MRTQKVYRILLSTFILLALLTLAACGSGVFQTLFKEQEWSENYCLIDGVECTAPEMIDGDINTAGMTVFPDGVHGRIVYGAFPNAEVEVILPEKKSIRKIVIFSEDLECFDVLACMDERGDWKLIGEIDNNTEKQIVIRTSVLTDRIKIRARPISDLAGSERRLERTVVHGSLMTLSTRSVEEPEIQEIELYGFRSAASGQSQEATSDKDMEILFK